SQLCYTTLYSCGKSGIDFFVQKSLRCLPCLRLHVWKGIPYLWKDKSFQERRIILPLVEYNIHKRIFPFLGICHNCLTISCNSYNSWARNFSKPAWKGGFPLVTSRAQVS